ncbi:Fc.00g102730.m01.CDS01 [Cosmosporella sp. VM-42]
MTPQDGRSKIGGVCAATDCPRILLFNTKFCPAHQTDRAASTSSEPLVDRPTNIKPTKRLCGPEARFVAKKSENILRRGRTRRSSASDQSKSSEATTRSIPNLHAYPTARQPTPTRPYLTTESWEAKRREKSANFPKALAIIPPKPGSETSSSHSYVPSQAQNGISKHRAIAGDEQSSEDTGAENRDRISKIQTEVRKLSEECSIDKSDPTGVAKISSLSEYQKQMFLAKRDHAITDMTRVGQRQNERFFYSKQQKEPSERKPSKEYFSAQISNEVIQKHLITQPSWGNTGPVDTTKTRSVPAVSLLHDPIIQRTSDRHALSSRPSADPEKADSSRAHDNRHHREMSQDGSRTSREDSTQARPSRNKTRIELLLEQRAANIKRLAVESEQSTGHVDSNQGQVGSISQAGTMAAANGTKRKAGDDFEARRKAKVAAFDSRAFDSMIYQQSSIRPPEGVLVSRRPPDKTTASIDEQFLFLPVNPAIHRPHRRSDEWYRKKSKEIKDRGGRKTWFGRATARHRWLKSQEAAKEQERVKALKTGKVPPRKDPEPFQLGNLRIKSFTETAEEDLPDDVKENPAWLKGCAWMRKTTQQLAQRIRARDKATQETQVFYFGLVNGRSA